MTKEELDFIGSMNMCDEISNEAYKKIVCHCEDQQPCEDAVNRQAVHSLMAMLLSGYLYDEDREKIELIDAEIAELSSVTPKEKTGMWINDWEMGMSECSCCGENYLWEDHKGTENFHYCPNCGARMQEVEENG